MKKECSRSIVIIAILFSFTNTVKRQVFYEINANFSTAKAVDL
jgi:hypothetical protein